MNTLSSLYGIPMSVHSWSVYCPVCGAEHEDKGDDVIDCDLCDTRSLVGEEEVSWVTDYDMGYVDSFPLCPETWIDGLKGADPS